MISTPLLHNGVALLEVNMTAFDGISMKNWEFIVDAGATRTTIPRTVLVDVLKSTDDYIQSNKVLLTEKEKHMTTLKNKSCHMPQKQNTIPCKFLSTLKGTCAKHHIFDINKHFSCNILRKGRRVSPKVV